jgi:hypothetical protein
MICDACDAYMLVAQEKRPLMLTFVLYVALHEPRLLRQEVIDSTQSFGAAKQLSKSKFFSEFLPAYSRVTGGQF